MLTYHTKRVHSCIKITPYEATKPSNAIEVKTNIELQASFTIKHPELEIGSNVKVYKQKTLGQAEPVSRFSPAILTVNNIIEQHGQTYYTVEGKYKLNLIVEMLKGLNIHSGHFQTLDYVCINTNYHPKASLD